MATRSIVVTDEAELAPYLDGWDRLAIAARRPFCAPAWMLAWWREGRSGKTVLRVVLVLDGERLIGVGPFFGQISYGLTELRLLGAGFSHRIGPLAEPGEEARVATAIAETVASLKPRPASVVFEGVDAEDPWPDLLAEAWSGRRPRLRTDSVMEAPVIHLDGSDDAWMERRTRNFRKLARRTSKRLGETDVTSRIGADEAAVKGFLHLHRLRWDQRGGSNLDDSAERVIAAAATEMGAGRLEIILLEGPEGPVSAELMLRTGPVAAIWATGFDPDWSQYAPGLQVRLVTLRAAARHGVQLVDLGGGAAEYKVRMADGDMPIAWRTLFPAGLRYPMIRLRLAPKHLRQAARRAAHRLPDRQLERLKRLLRRG